MKTDTIEKGITLKDPGLFRQASYIDGAWVTAPSGAVITVDNPATGEAIGTVPKLGAAETRQAIDAAARAFDAWRTTTAKDRAIVMRRWFDLMIENRDDLARLMTTEQASPLPVARKLTVRASLSNGSRGSKRVYATRSRATRRQAHSRQQAADWRLACSPLEFSARHQLRKAGPPSPRAHPGAKPASQTPFSALALRMAQPRRRAKACSRQHRAFPSEHRGPCNKRNHVRKLSLQGSPETGTPDGPVQWCCGW